MATMNAVIEYIDNVKPNVYTEEDKYRWINQLDGRISTEVMGMAEPKQYDTPKDADQDLLVPHPYDDVYALYVAAMIDFFNKEYTNYNNSVLMFTERMEAFKAWYIRTHQDNGAKNFRNVMG